MSLTDVPLVLRIDECGQKRNAAGDCAGDCQADGGAIPKKKLTPNECVDQALANDTESNILTTVVSIIKFSANCI